MKIVKGRWFSGNRISRYQTVDYQVCVLYSSFHETYLIYWNVFGTVPPSAFDPIFNLGILLLHCKICVIYIPLNLMDKHLFRIDLNLSKHHE